MCFIIFIYDHLSTLHIVICVYLLVKANSRRWNKEPCSLVIAVFIRTNHIICHYTILTRSCFTDTGHWFSWLINNSERYSLSCRWFSVVGNSHGIGWDHMLSWIYLVKWSFSKCSSFPQLLFADSCSKLAALSLSNVWASCFALFWENHFSKWYATQMLGSISAVLSSSIFVPPRAWAHFPEQRW